MIGRGYTLWRRAPLAVGNRMAMLCGVFGVVVVLGVGCSTGSASSGSSPGSPGAVPSSSGSGAGSAPPTEQPTAVTSSIPASGSVHVAAVELRPEDPYPGGQLVVLVNDADEPIDVTCWTVRSARLRTSARVLAEDAIPPGGYLRLFPERVLFDSVDTLSLLDDRGQKVDQTPTLTDRTADDRLWFRRDTGTWILGRGFRLPEGVEDGRLVDGANNC